MTKPPRSEQLRALLEHRAAELVERVIPANELSANSYESVFDITRRDIRDYLRDPGRFDSYVKKSAGDVDGYYVIRRNSGFEVYEQERGLKLKTSFVDSIDEAIDEFVDYVVRTSGTGLDF